MDVTKAKNQLAHIKAEFAAVQAELTEVEAKIPGFLAAFDSSVDTYLRIVSDMADQVFPQPPEGSEEQPSDIDVRLRSYQTQLDQAFRAFTSPSGAMRQKEGEIRLQGLQDLGEKMAPLLADLQAKADQLADRAARLVDESQALRILDEDDYLRRVTTRGGRCEAVGDLELSDQPGEAPMIAVGRMQAPAPTRRWGQRSILGHEPLMLSTTQNVIFLGEDEACEQALRALVCRLLYSREPASFRPRFFDPTDQGHRVGPFHPLLTVEQLGGSTVACGPKEIPEALDQMRGRVQQVHQQALKGQYKTLTEFNRHERHQYFMAAIALGLGAAWSPQQIQDLAHLATMGPKAGVNVVAAVSYDFPDDKSMQRSLGRLMESPDTVCFTNCKERDGQVWAVLNGEGVVLDAVSDDQVHNVRRQMEVVASWGRENLTPDLGAAKITEPRGGVSSLHGLDIPVGVDAEKVVSLKFDDDSPHGLVIGRSGSGKSVLLSTLVYAAAQAYSVDELELWLIDLKEGNEFKDYADLPDNPGLPHARVIAGSSDPTFAVKVLEALADEVSNRGKMLRAVQGAKNLPDYRTKTGKSVPRLLAIIDEAFVILGREDKMGARAWRALELISKQGRYVGVHTLLANQSLAGLGTHGGPRKGVWNQYPLRIALRCNPSDAELIFAAGNKSAFGLAGKGQAVVNWDGGLPGRDVQIQVAMFAEAEMRSLREELSKRWPRRSTQIAFLDDELAVWKPIPAAEKLSISVGQPMSLESHEVVELDRVKSVALFGPTASILPLMVAADRDLRSQRPLYATAVVHASTDESKDAAETLAQHVDCATYDEAGLLALLDQEERLPEILFCPDLSDFPSRHPSTKSDQEVWSRLVSRVREERAVLIAGWPSEGIAKQRFPYAQLTRAFPICVAVGTGSLGPLRGEITGDPELTPFGTPRTFIPWAMPERIDEYGN